MNRVKLNRTEKLAFDECMNLLAKAVMKMDTKTDALLFFQFEDLLNRTFDVQTNHSDQGGVVVDGRASNENWLAARKEYIELAKELNHK